MSQAYIHNGRSLRVRQHLVNHPGGLTSRQLVDALNDGSTASTMCTTVATLLKTKKVRREFRGGVAVYFPTATTLVDSRRRVDAAHRAPKPVELVTHVQAPVSAAMATSAPRRMGLNALFLKPADRQLDRRAIAADVAAFEAAGGKVQKLAWGDTGESLRAAQSSTSRAKARTT